MSDTDLEEANMDRCSLTISHQMEMLKEWAADLGCAIVPLEIVTALLKDLGGPCDFHDCPQCKLYAALSASIAAAQEQSDD